MKFTKVLFLTVFSGLMLTAGFPVCANDGETVSLEHANSDSSKKPSKSFGQRLKSSACQGVENTVKWALPTALVCTALYYSMVRPLTQSMNGLGKDLRSYEHSLSSLADSFTSLKDSFGKMCGSFDKVANIAGHIQDSHLYRWTIKKL